ncbi:MAG: hypothetical protein JXA30_13660 [Deltaproteobacteria bacterium]|nr:hypothetical protein [Deltaproteobacteria bacterium]
MEIRLPVIVIALALLLVYHLPRSSFFSEPIDTKSSRLVRQLQHWSRNRLRRSIRRAIIVDQGAPQLRASLEGSSARLSGGTAQSAASLAPRNSAASPSSRLLASWTVALRNTRSYLIRQALSASTASPEVATNVVAIRGKGVKGDVDSRALERTGEYEPTRSVRARVAPEEYEGLKQQIEDPGGRALAAFYLDLKRTAKGETGAITRIAHYGDSAVASDHITSTLRRRLQSRFGDAGHGFILISRGTMHYRHRDIRHRADGGWKIFSLVYKALGTDWYGYGGVQVQGTAGSSAQFATVKTGPIGRRVSRFEVFYQAYQRGGAIKVTVDGEERRAWSTRSGQRKDAWETIELDDAPHSITVKSTGRSVVRLYGVALERRVPGVIYDSLGMVGGQMHRLLNAEPEHTRRQIEHRDPSLIVLGFGGNEAFNQWLNLENYERDLTRVVRMFRGDKGYPCLLFGPLDQGETDKRGKVVTIAKLPRVIDVQRRVALTQQCAYFNTYSAMGGERSIWRWYKQRPRLATSDLKHATPAGYRVIGELFYKALLKGFADFLEKE